MLTAQQTDFLKMAADQALKCEAATGLPALLSLTQAVFESGWGQHAPGNNYFGLKANGRGVGTQALPTQEYRGGRLVVENHPFEIYESAEACFDDHAWLITKARGYSEPWTQYLKDRNFDALVIGIAPHYAPGNLGYAATIISFAESTTVQGAIVAAKQRVSAG